MKIIFVAGAWGSGTTALAGALAKLGVSALGPHFQTNDPKTPNSYELVPFRQVILRFVDQPTLTFRSESNDEFVEALKGFAQALANETFGEWPPDKPRRAFLKMPLATLCIPQITAVFDTSIVMVRRPYGEIEASRKRRGWPSNFGSESARVIYQKALVDLKQLNKTSLEINHKDLVRESETTLNKVIEFCDLQDLRPNLSVACGFIRNDIGLPQPR